MRMDIAFVSRITQRNKSSKTKFWEYFLWSIRYFEIATHPEYIGEYRQNVETLCLEFHKNMAPEIDEGAQQLQTLKKSKKVI